MVKGHWTRTRSGRRKWISRHSMHVNTKVEERHERTAMKILKMDIAEAERTLKRLPPKERASVKRRLKRLVRGV